MNKNSMLYWWPLIEILDIPKPQTKIISLDLSWDEMFGILDGEKESAQAWDVQIPILEKTINEVGLPAFIRTDYTSDKHDWDKSCYLDDLTNLKRTISNLTEMTLMCDLSLEALVVREYIEMDFAFTAFSGNMPVNPERRYFIKDGEIQCHHAYWVAEAIAEWNQAWDRMGKSRLPSNWMELLAEMNTETDEEVKLLSGYALQIATIMDGYWSVDFCKAKDGRWIFIDMAEGDMSWHDERCKYHSTRSESI